MTTGIVIAAAGRGERFSQAGGAGNKLNAEFADATGRQVANRLLVISNVALKITGAGFDIFVHGHTFHHAPRQAGFGDELLALLDFGHRPYFAIRDVVQGRHQVGSAGLADVGEAYGVVGAKPAPALNKGHIFNEQLSMSNYQAFSVMLSGAQRSRSISTSILTPSVGNEAVEMLRLRCAPLSMTVGVCAFVRFEHTLNLFEI